MNTHITKKTIPVRGICPIDGQSAEIDVTYGKYQPLGSTCAYAVVINIDCGKADKGCPIEECPIAYSHTYW